MQIVIPMSGFGERFRRAGYAVPKPLIEIDGKPIIAHVIDMFPGEHDFIFICNEDHLQCADYGMRGVLQALCPTGTVVGIAAHKLGPVHAVQQVEHLIDPQRPVVLNYCDFTCLWDWSHFKAFVLSSACDGAIPAYKGFHPHTLGTTNYAYMREVGGRVMDIQEKQPYTDDRMNEYASSGTYYFRSGEVLKQALAETRRRNLQVNGEYYVSLAYKPMLDAGQDVRVYALQHFMQWGTPEDVAEYGGWSDAFRVLAEDETAQSEVAAGAMIVPMAGMGHRFAREGYLQTKPLIPVSGRPMVLQAAHDLPQAKQHAFVLRTDMPGRDDIGRALLEAFPGAILQAVPHVTEGQACSANVGLSALVARAGDVAEPITFGACDNGALYDRAAFDRLMSRVDVDVVVWVVRGHANAVRHPQMFGWVEAEESGRIRRVSVKQPLAQPAHDPIVIGTFTFKRRSHFDQALQRLLEQNDRINDEFYLDSTVNHALALGLRCHVFEVDHFFSWGTPNDLRTFEYWQSCFDKWASHPYALERDQRVPEAAVQALRARYQWVHPEPQGMTA